MHDRGHRNWTLSYMGQAFGRKNEKNQADTRFGMNFCLRHYPTYMIYHSVRKCIKHFNINNSNTKFLIFTDKSVCRCTTMSRLVRDFVRKYKDSFQISLNYKMVLIFPDIVVCERTKSSTVVDGKTFCAVQPIPRHEQIQSGPSSYISPPTRIFVPTDCSKYCRHSSLLAYTPDIAARRPGALLASTRFKKMFFNFSLLQLSCSSCCC